METIPHLREIRLRWLALCVLMIGLLFGIAFFQESDLQEFYVYLIAVLLFAFYIILMVLCRKKSIAYGNLLIILSVLTMMDLSFNAYELFSGYTEMSVEDRYQNRSAIDLTQQITLDKGERVALSDADADLGMWISQNTVGGFASVSNPGVIRMLAMLGVSQYAGETGVSYDGGSPLLNFMFNVKYGVGTDDLLFSDMELTDSEGEMNLYEMKRTGSIGYMVNSDVEEWDPSVTQLFSGQNDFAEKATGIGDFMTSLPFDATVQVDYGTLNMGDDYKYSFVATNDTSMVLLTYEVPEDMDLYMYSFIDKSDALRIVKIDGEQVHADWGYNAGGTLHIGKVKKGQVVTMDQFIYGYLGEEVRFCYLLASYDEEQYQKIYDKLSENLLELEEFEDTYVKGTIEAEEDGILMTSIPAKDGFTVYVDGEETEFKTIGNALIGVPVSSGTHTIEFKYRTPYFREGLIGSVIGLLIFCGVCGIEMLKKRRKCEMV
jgi:uncharacterized membrane protein YfhO